MMDLARKHNMVPVEIYIEKGKMAEDMILWQVLTYDLARQWKIPLIVVLVDTTQYYDRISHAMTALTFRAFKVREYSVLSMLTLIQNMEYYICTGFGESSIFVGGKGDKKQELRQRNIAAPSTW